MTLCCRFGLQKTRGGKWAGVLPGQTALSWVLYCTDVFRDGPHPAARKGLQRSGFSTTQCSEGDGMGDRCWVFPEFRNGETVRNTALPGLSGYPGHKQASKELAALSGDGSGARGKAWFAGMPGTSSATTGFYEAARGLGANNMPQQSVK